MKTAREKLKARRNRPAGMSAEAWQDKLDIDAHSKSLHAVDREYAFKRFDELKELASDYLLAFCDDEEFAYFRENFADRAEMITGIAENLCITEGVIPPSFDGWAECSACGSLTPARLPSAEKLIGCPTCANAGPVEIFKITRLTAERATA